MFLSLFMVWLYECFCVALFCIVLQMAEIDLDWPKKDNRRFLHVVYSVGDLERTIKYV